jgi:hypothetical protein
MIGYFLLGLVWDAIVCIDLIATAHGLWFLAGITTIILTVLSFEVYDKLVAKGLKRPLIYSLATGSAIGTMIAVKYLELY